MSKFLDLGLISAAIRIGAPLLFAALGTVFVSSPGMINISVEGSMLVGTFAAVVISYLTQSALLGFLVAGAAGLLLAAGVSFLIVKWKGDPIVVGIGGNLFAWGVTVFFLEEILHMRGTFTGSPVPFFHPLGIPLLQGIPVVREIISGYNMPVYLSVLLAIIIWVMIYKTPSGSSCGRRATMPRRSARLGPTWKKCKCCALWPLASWQDWGGPASPSPTSRASGRRT